MEISLTRETWTQRCARVGRGASALLGLAALMVLLGWATGTDWLVRGWPDSPALHPLTAVCFLLLSISLGTSASIGNGPIEPPGSTEGPFQWSRRAGLWTALVGGLLAGGQLMHYLVGSHIGLDQLLFPGVSSNAATSAARMSLASALAIGCGALASILLRGRSPRSVEIGQSLALLAGFVGIVSLAGHVFGAQYFYGFTTSVYTAVLLCVLAVGLCCLRPGDGLMGVLGDNGAASQLLRWLLPAVIILPYALGAIHLWFRQQEILDMESGVLFQVVVSGIIFLAVTGIAVKILYRQDQWRQETDETLRRLNMQLDHRVRERTAELEEANEKLRSEIDQRKQAEQAARESEEGFRRVVEASLNGFVMINEQGIIVLVNQQTEQLFGYHREELIGQPVEMLVPDRLRGGHPRFRDGFIANPQARPMGKGRDLYAQRKDGSQFPVEIGLNPLRTAQGLVVLATVIDIAERKRIEQEIRAFNADLERRVEQRTHALVEANKELESFSYSVSHDLRAPLRHIRGYVELLIEDTDSQLSAEGQRFLGVIADASREMSEFIDDLLAFSRMGRVEMRQASVDLDGLLQETIHSLEMATQGRHIVWRIASLPRVIGDPVMLKQVLVNLLGNAIKYSRPRDPAEIELGCRGLEDGYVILFVRDNGVGFDMKYADKIFGVFQRLHRAEEFEGTGIGLANVRRIIGRHGGRVWAEAAPDQGATFFFTLKASPPSSSGIGGQTHEVAEDYPAG